MNRLSRIPTWMVFVVSVVIGALLFAAGFRVTEEVIPIVGGLLLSGWFMGFVRPERAWLWGLGIGIGTRLFPEPPLSPEHVARYGPSQPLPLPFGLTHDSRAQWVAGSLLIMSFPLVGACVGWLFRRIASR